MLADETEIVRDRVRSVFTAVAMGDVERGRTLYALHLAVLLLWTLDPTAAKATIDDEVDRVEDLIESTDSIVARFLGVPCVQSIVEQLREAEPSTASGCGS